MFRCFFFLLNRRGSRETDRQRNNFHLQNYPSNDHSNQKFGTPLRSPTWVTRLQVFGWSIFAFQGTYQQNGGYYQDKIPIWVLGVPSCDSAHCVSMTIATLILPGKIRYFYICTYSCNCYSGNHTCGVMLICVFGW